MRHPTAGFVGIAAGLLTFLLLPSFLGEPGKPGDKLMAALMVGTIVAVLVDWCIRQTVASPHTLLSAANEGRLGKVRKILDAGVDVNTLVDGHTALIAAVLGDNCDVVSLLLERGADPSRQYSDGISALMVAAGRAQNVSCKMLLDHGADHSSRNSQGHTALMVASSKGFAETVKMFIDSGADLALRSPGA